MKPRDKNTFPIIFLTVRPTPHCAVKEAHKVQEQCKSKCYFSIPRRPPTRPRPVICSSACFTGVPLGPGSPPSLSSSEDNIMLQILWKGALLWDAGKTPQHQLALSPAGSLSLPTMQAERGRRGVLCWRSRGVKGGASWQEVKSSWEGRIRRETPKKLSAF